MRFLILGRSVGLKRKSLGKKKVTKRQVSKKEAWYPSIIAVERGILIKTTWEKGSTTETPMRHTMAVRMRFKVIFYVFG